MWCGTHTKYTDTFKHTPTCSALETQCLDVAGGLPAVLKLLDDPKGSAVSVPCSAVCCSFAVDCLLLRTCIFHASDNTSKNTHILFKTQDLFERALCTLHNLICAHRLLLASAQHNSINGKEQQHMRDSCATSNVGKAAMNGIKNQHFTTEISAPAVAAAVSAVPHYAELLRAPQVRVYVVSVFYCYM